MQAPDFVLFDCDILGSRDPEWDGRTLRFEGYLLIPKEKFWRFWLLAACVKLFRLKPAEAEMNKSLPQEP